MLRNRSRAVTSKQGIMSDHGSVSSPTDNHRRLIPSFLGSPRFFADFLAKGLFESSENAISPTSILENKQFSPLANNTFAFDNNISKSEPKNTSPEIKHTREALDSEAIGLAIIDSLSNDGDGYSKPNSGRMVLFGSNLKIQIPPVTPSTISTSESPKSPADFGIKTPNSQKLAFLSALNYGNLSNQTKESPRDVARHLSLSEMELSEDYTCVISHGPNPRTTHIYDNCIVETCCGLVGLSKLKKKYGFPSDNPNSLSVNFLSLCCRCNRKLGEGKDIYIYRGEKAFCSHECRCQEMLLDGIENPEPDRSSRTYP